MALSLGRFRKRGVDALRLPWVSCQPSVLHCSFCMRSHVLQPHFENYSSHVKKWAEVWRRRAVMGSPLQGPRSMGLASSSLFLFPRRSSPWILPGVRIDDSCSKNSSLYLKDQPKKGNFLASGILLGNMGDPALSPKLGEEGMLFFRKAADVSVS